MSVRNRGSQAPHFGNPGRTPLPEKKLSAPPPRGSYSLHRGQLQALFSQWWKIVFYQWHHQMGSGRGGGASGAEPPAVLGNKCHHFIFFKCYRFNLVQSSPESCPMFMSSSME